MKLGILVHGMWYGVLRKVGSNGDNCINSDNRDWRCCLDCLADPV